MQYSVGIKTKSFGIHQTWSGIVALSLYQPCSIWQIYLSKPQSPHKTKDTYLIRMMITYCLYHTWHSVGYVNFQFSNIIDYFIVTCIRSRLSRNGIQHSYLIDRLEQILNITKCGPWYLLEGQGFMQSGAAPRQQEQDEGMDHQGQENEGH